MPELAEVEVARLNVARWWEGRAAEEVVVHDANVAKGEGGVESRWLHFAGGQNIGPLPEHT